MSFYGTISNFRSFDNHWVVDVDYWDDANPDKKIPRTLDFPLSTTKAEVVSAIKEKGAEVRQLATLNTQAIIGTNILIP